MPNKFLVISLINLSKCRNVLSKMVFSIFPSFSSQILGYANYGYLKQLILIFFVFPVYLQYYRLQPNSYTCRDVTFVISDFSTTINI